MPKGTPGREQCSVPQCERLSNALGMCGMHYRRVKDRGVPDPRVRPTSEERFWAKVRKTDACWIWTGNKTPEGYGTFALTHKKIVGAHRRAYTLLVGPIPAGLTLDHLCRNPPCVNPAHLEPVTQRENTLRGISPAALNAAKTHCLRGHPFDSSNTFVNNRGERQCKTCTREHNRRRVRAS